MMTRFHRIPTLALCAALLLGLALPAQASKGNDDACSILDVSLTSEQVAALVDSALAIVPGTVVKVGYEVGRNSDGDPVPYLEVVIIDTAGARAFFYYDAETGDPITPPAP